MPVRFGYQCEECEQAIWLATTRAELQWLKNRRHIVREVRAHVSGGLEGWMDEGLAFVEEHAGHPIVVVERSP